MATIEYGVWASDRPSDTSEAALLLAGAGEQYNGVLRVCNQDSVEHTYSFAHCAATGVAAGKDWIAYEAEIPANKTREWSVHLGNSQEIRRQSGAADKVNFHISGMRITA